MNRIARAAIPVGLATALSAAAVTAQDKPGFRDTPMLPGGQWHVHDPDRPYPPVVTPGATAGAAPSDAITLFDGSSLDAWQGQKGPWEIKDGAMTAPPQAKGGGGNSLISRQSFGDVQLLSLIHI